MADDWATTGDAPSGYLPAEDFRAAMDSIYGAGNWRETGGWRSQSREQQLRATGAATVKPGATSWHSLGTEDAPGAHDIVVNGMTPQQAAAKLRASQLPVGNTFPEDAAGSQGAHLHVGMAPGLTADPWATTTAASSDPWATANATPEAKPKQDLLTSASRLVGSFVGGAEETAAATLRGGGKLLDALARQQARQYASGVSPEGIPLPVEASRQAAAAAAADKTPVIGSAVDPWATSLEQTAAKTEPADRSTAESIAHGAGGFVPALGAAAINPALGAAVFGAGGYEQGYEEAQHAGAPQDAVERAAAESGALQAGVGLIPFGKALEPVVGRVGGALLAPLARTGAEVAGGGAAGAAIQTGENVIAQQNYDPDRPLFQGVPQAAAEMALGAGAIHGATEVGGAVGARLRPREQPATPAPEQAAAAAQQAMPEAVAAQAYRDMTQVRQPPPEEPQASTWTPERESQFQDAVVRGDYAAAAAAEPKPASAVAANPIPTRPPPDYEAARIAEGADPEHMPQAIADVAELRQAAPKSYNVFQAMKDLGGIRTKDAEGNVDGDVAQALGGARMPGLINNKTGLTPDAMREALQERGWFGAFDQRQGAEQVGPKPGDNIQDLFDLMDRHVRDGPVRHPEAEGQEQLTRRAELESEMLQAGVGAKDLPPVAAAKLAAWRGALAKQSGEEMASLIARADSSGVPHVPGMGYDELLGDVVEREAIQHDYDGAAADHDEHLIDAELTPEEHEWLSAAGRGAEGEQESPGGLAEALRGAAPESGAQAGGGEPGEGAGGGGAGAHEVSGLPELVAVDPNAIVQAWEKGWGPFRDRHGEVEAAMEHGRQILVPRDVYEREIGGSPFEAHVREHSEFEGAPDPWAIAGESERHNLGHETVDQGVLGGMTQSAQQASAARGETLKPKTAQQEPGGLFGAPEPKQEGLFEERQPVTPPRTESQINFDQIKAEGAALRAEAESLAEPGKPVRFEHADGRTALAGPDPSKPGKFRLTTFDKAGEPSGHVEFSSLKAAISDALSANYKAAAEGEAKRLEDVGEKIGGARKDVWASRGLSVDDLEGMTTAEAHANVVKEQVWPKPDYAAEVEAGVDPVAAAMKKIIRDKLGAKPRVDSAVGRRNYIEMMGAVRAALDRARTVDDVRLVRDKILYDELNWPREYYNRPEKEVSDKLFSIMKGRRDTLGIDNDDRRKAEKMVADGFPAQIEPWTRKYDLRKDSSGNWGLYAKKTYRPIEVFAERGDAEAKAKSLYEEAKASGADKDKLPVRPHLDKVQRQGPEVREGRDVSGDDFLHDFGFRAVEFGNWVASDERQRAANMAYDALRDLAAVTGVSPKALSLDGKLALAFGARGKGGFAAAHYEPGRLVINLTKLSGAGTLAHEFGHALDHYFGQLDRPETDKGAVVGASGWYERRHSPNVNMTSLKNLRPEMQDAFGKVMKAIFTKNLDRAEAVRELELRQERIQAQRDKATETLADPKTVGTFRKQMETYASDLDRQKRIVGDSLARARDEAQPFTGPARRSSYDTEAQKLSGKAGDKGYWARPTEMFARAFEAYTFDKLKTEGNRSDYLVQGVEPERYENGGYKGNPYPKGLERDAINAAFDHLFATMQEREGERGPVLFQAGNSGGKLPGNYREITRGLQGREITPEQANDVVDRVSAVLARIAPHAEAKPFAALRTDAGKQAFGATFRDGAGHVIAWALDAPDALQTVRHEAVHALRTADLFKPAEWSALSSEALRGDWLGRFNIHDRYPDLNPEQQVEEAIAERYGEWRQDIAVKDLPSFAKALFQRIGDALHQVGAAVRQVLGHDVRAEDVFRAIESGKVGAREPGAPPDRGVRYAVPPDDAKALKVRGVVNKALGDGLDAVGAKISRTAADVLPDPLIDFGDAIRMGLNPMAAGSQRAQATAKDFANAWREHAWEWSRVDRWLENTFTPEQRRKMWEAADEESVVRQRGGEPGPVEGLNRLAPEERAAVEELQKRANAAFGSAKDLGMTTAEGLPSYVPRMVVEMTAEGAKRLRPSGEQGSGSSSVGRNLKTTSAQLKQRKYLEASETEAAAQKAFGEGAMVVRDIRTLALATGKLEQAVAGRRLVQHIKEAGAAVGENLVSEGASADPKQTFTLDHPAMRTWRPKLTKDPATGKWSTVDDPATGRPVMESQPLYIAKEFEGPLKAVLTQSPGAVEKALMTLKGKAMSVIMYSPLMHNAVIWGKAIPAAPKAVLGFTVYRKGYLAKTDPATMREAIRAGLDPIGKKFFNQDITAIASPPQIEPGQSWTAKLLAANIAAPARVASLVAGGKRTPAGRDLAEGADRLSRATKEQIDRLGDLWHNTFLWDRVGDLQMGIYTILRDSFVKHGMDPQTGQRVAAHYANRYAGALPMEAMSKLARNVANITLFSRSFTMTNLGAWKDAVAGLPTDVQAQILRDKGFQELKQAQGTARGKAMAMIVMDVALAHVGLLLAAGAVWGVHHMLGDPSFAFQGPGGNEKGKENRVLMGYQPDGTAIYGRLPTGKVAEDLLSWITEPISTAERKLSPYGKVALEVASNDKGFGRKLYDPYDKTPLGFLRNTGRVVLGADLANLRSPDDFTGGLLGSFTPVGLLQGLAHLGSKSEDPRTAALEATLPLFGITVSKGAPGGPAMGDLFRAQDEHDFQVAEKLPGIRKDIKAGRVTEARQMMTKLGIAPGLQSYYVRTTLNPAQRLTGRKLHDFLQYATPADRSAFEADQAAALSRRQPVAP